MHIMHREALRKWSGGILCAVCVALLLFQVCTIKPPQVVETTFTASGRDGAFVLPEGGGGTIDVNHADLEELVSLPGIGETIARLIIEQREKTPFHLPEDLLTVKGIGASKLEAIRRLICFE